MGPFFYFQRLYTHALCLHFLTYLLLLVQGGMSMATLQVRDIVTEPEPVVKAGLIIFINRISSKCIFR